MRKLVLSIALVGTLVACGDEDPAPAPEAPAVEEPKPEPKPEPEPVKAEFDAAAEFGKTCGTCHGAEGKGDGPAGAALNPKPANFTDAAFWTDERTKEHLIKVIGEGGPSVGKSALMAPYGGMYDADQIAALADHIMSMKPE